MVKHDSYYVIKSRAKFTLSYIFSEKRLGLMTLFHEFLENVQRLKILVKPKRRKKRSKLV